MSKIGLREAIASLRSELEDAMKDGAHKDLRFELGDINLEFQVGVTLEGTGKAQVKFWLFELGSVEAGASRATTQTIKLVLKPKKANGNDSVILSGDRPD